VKERDNLRNLDLEEMIIGYDGMDWIELAHNRDQWRVIMKRIINLGFHKRRGIS